MCARLLICATILALVAEYRANPAMTMEQIQKTALNVRNTCANKVHADIDIVAGIQNGAFPENRELECYALCVMKTMRTFKNGHIDEEMMIKQLDLMMPADRAPRLKEMTRICAPKPPAADDCKTALQYVKCQYEIDSQNFFFP